MLRNTAPQTDRDDDDGWFRDGSVRHSREDRLAKAFALVALLFSLSIGLVIALLPVSAQADPARAGDRLEYRAV
jgi:hypothetical protein